MTILVTAATGRTGRLAIAALSARDRSVPIRAFARRPVPGLPPGCDLVLGDLDDAAARERAVAGVTTVVHYGPPVDPRETPIGTGMIDAAVAAGVERFVFVSVLHPQIEDLQNHQTKLAVEAYLINAGIRWTILRPQHFMQNVNIADTLTSGAVSLPYPRDTPLGQVDMADMAEAIAKVALESGHDYASYDISGDEHLSGGQIAAIIAEVTGKAIGYRQLSVEDLIARRWRERAPTNFTIEGYHRVCSYYSRRGIQGNGNHLRWLLGRESGTFVEFVERSLNAA